MIKEKNSKHGGTLHQVTRVLNYLCEVEFANKREIREATGISNLKQLIPFLLRYDFIYANYHVKSNLGTKMTGYYSITPHIKALHYYGTKN